MLEACLVKGYLIVNFLLEMGHASTLQQAHDMFEKSRGYSIDKDYLLNDLKRRLGPRTNPAPN